MTPTVAVHLEVGSKRVFAGAIDWPGWCRSGRTEDEALAALLAYGPRYAKVVGRTAIPFTPPTDPNQLEVVERLQGGWRTDFGVPGVAPSSDERPMDEADLDRSVELLTAGWAAFDAAAEAAAGLELRKGPRGGGRDLGKIVGHVLEADVAYLSQLGGRRPPSSSRDPMGQMLPLRETILAVLAARARDEPIAQPSRTRTLWSPRYFVRRAAWHLLDHAWEIEDRST